LIQQQAAQQAAEYERLNQAHRLRQQESAAHARHGSNSSPKSSSSGSSVGDKTANPTAKTSFSLAKPFPTQQLTKYVFCDQCNCDCIRLLLPNVSSAKRVDLLLVCPCRVLMHALKKRCKMLRIKIVY